MILTPGLDNEKRIACDSPADPAVAPGGEEMDEIACWDISLRQGNLPADNPILKLTCIQICRKKVVV